MLSAALASGCSVDAAPLPAMDPGAYTPAIGTNARTEQVDALGFAVVLDDDGNGRVVGTLKKLDLPYPTLSPKAQADLERVKAQLAAETRDR